MELVGEDASRPTAAMKAEVWAIEKKAIKKTSLFFS